MLQNPYTLRLSSRHWHWAWLHTSQQHALNELVRGKTCEESNKSKLYGALAVTTGNLLNQVTPWSPVPVAYCQEHDPTPRMQLKQKNENPSNKFLQSAHHPGKKQFLQWHRAYKKCILLESGVWSVDLLIQPPKGGSRGQEPEPCKGLKNRRN